MTRWVTARAEEVRQPVSDETLSGFNVGQLWSLYIGLRRLELVEPLQSAVQQLAEQLYQYGSKHHWRHVVTLHDFGDSEGGQATGSSVEGGGWAMIVCPECNGTGTCHGCEYEEEYDLLGGLPKHDRCLRCDGVKEVVA